MAIDILSLGIGLFVGGAAVAMVMEVMGRARAPATPAATTKLTSGWRLRELGSAVLVARDVLDIEVPPGTAVFASGVVDPDVLATCDVRQVPAVRTEFAFDAKERRALVFTAGVTEGALALVTVDADLVGRLETEWKTLASRADAYVERLRISDLAGKAGVTVETRGFVQDVLPFQDRYMIRLEDQGHVIGVLVDRDPSALKEERVQVKGALEKRTGYPVIVAEDIRRVR